MFYLKILYSLKYKLQSKSWNEISAEELYQCMQLRSQVFVVEQSCSYLDLDGADKISQHIWAEEEGKVLSYLRVINLEEKYKIGRVCTDSAFRNQGLATELMNTAMDWISEHHVHNRVQLSAQQHLVAFYQQWGFEPVGEIYLDVGIPHQDMILEIGFSDFN